MKKAGLPIKFIPKLGATLAQNIHDFYFQINAEFQIYDRVGGRGNEKTQRHGNHLSIMRELILGVTDDAGLKSLINKHYEIIEEIHIDPNSGCLRNESVVMEFAYSKGNKDVAFQGITTIYVTHDVLKHSSLGIIVRPNAGFVMQSNQSDMTGQVGVVSGGDFYYDELHVRFIPFFSRVIPMATYECILIDGANEYGKDFVDAVIGQCAGTTPILATDG